MKLESIKYSHFVGEPNEWNLDLLTLGDKNLIVGKNASGKTKTLNIINNLAMLLRGQRKPDSISSSNFEAYFKHEEKKYHYLLHIAKHVVIKEEFKIDGKKLLTRTHDGVGKIFAQKLNEEIDFQTPNTEIAFTARQDKLQHPYFLPLHQWAESVFHYAFGTPLGKNTFSVVQKDGLIEFDHRNAEMVVGIYKKGENDFGISFKEAIKNDMKKIGYDISDVGVDRPQSFEVSGLLGLWVKEKDIKNRTEQMEISQGMFRALSLIIQINYSKMALKPNCILIDDIGEGLDFERSCSLIELLMSKAKESKAQLVMTTNDRFVMNKVPLEDWTILDRKGSYCHVINVHTHQKQFEDFRFTGLNNFDFFATDYLDEGKK